MQISTITPGIGSNLAIKGPQSEAGAGFGDMVKQNLDGFTALQALRRPGLSVRRHGRPLQAARGDDLGAAGQSRARLRRDGSQPHGGRRSGTAPHAGVVVAEPGGWGESDNGVPKRYVPVLAGGLLSAADGDPGLRRRQRRAAAGDREHRAASALRDPLRGPRGEGRGRGGEATAGPEGRLPPFLLRGHRSAGRPRARGAHAARREGASLRRPGRVGAVRQDSHRAVGLRGEGQRPARAGGRAGPHHLLSRGRRTGARAGLAAPGAALHR